MNISSVFGIIKEKRMGLFMKALLDYVSTVTDIRQEKKVLHKMMDIIMLVFFAMLANADDWVEMEVFRKEHESSCGIIWNSQTGYLLMIQFIEFSQWCHRNFWKISRNSGAKC